MIATALIQCMIRTQAGWITLAARAGWSVTARLDMTVPWLDVSIPHYTPITGVFVTRIRAIEFVPPRHRWSQKSEPGCPGSRCASAAGTIQARIDYDGIRTVSTTWITPFD